MDKHSMDPSLQTLLDEWLRLDKNEDTRSEIQRIAAEDPAELDRCLRPRIRFGTSGLRARMSAGFARMNALTVLQTSQGLAAHLLATTPDARVRGVVLGFDGRHNSRRFAQLAAAALTHRGIKVWWYGEPCHTPLVPFGVVELRAAAGVMVTASHNPPADNGYKVWWANGCQIVPPLDAQIQAAILENLEPATWNQGCVDSSLLVEGSYNFVMEKYVTAVRAAVDPDGRLVGEAANHRCDFAYTALHGTGLAAMTAAMGALGIADSMKVVQEQAHPDPDFPGLPFPNPEEKGVLDVAMWSADRHGASLVVATDPDADRLAVAEKVPGVGWYIFTGNQLGALLASYVLERYTDETKHVHEEQPTGEARHVLDKKYVDEIKHALGKEHAGETKTLAMIASTVSSRMLAVMAAKEGFFFAETKTGFKWIGNKSLELDARGLTTGFGFEESIGYMLPVVVRDKDGVAAAGLFVAAAAAWRARGLSPHARLQALYDRYGFFEEANSYLVSPAPATTKAVFDAVRALGRPHPKTLGGRKVEAWRDLTLGYDSSTADGRPVLPVDPDEQMITCELHGGARLTVRASGTEPKIKVYVECHCRRREAAREMADEVLAAVVAEWLRPEVFNLKAS
jgi:phosphoglucomutase